MNERWAAIDQTARTAKRTAFAETKRGAKLLRERVRNVGTAVASAAVTVRDTLPAGLAFVSGSGAGWTIASSGGVITAATMVIPTIT